MEGTMSRLDEMGRRLAAEQDRMLADRDDLAEVRGRLAGTGAPRAGTRRHGWLPLAMAAGLAAALATGFLVAHALRSTGPAPGTGAESWRPGAWITAPDNAGVPIRFADGSAVRLEPGAEASVLSASATATRLALRRGGAQVDVVHREGVRWELEAGPFTIRITGTRFRIEWNPAAETFRLEMERGALDVTGPMLADGRRMAPGEVLRVWVAERRVEVRSDRGTTVAAVPAPPAAPASPAGSGASASPGGGTPATEAAPPVASLPLPTATAPAEPPVSPGVRTPPVRPAPHSTPGPGWRDLARAGRYHDAVAAAEGTGFERVLASASAAELLELGDAGRLGGRADRAEQAYLEIRDRFAGTSEAAVAAFDLGRLAFDVRRDYDAAVRWLRICLAEPRASGVAREASGRLIEALDRAGRAEAAATAAREYLRLDPDGPHADFARALLAGEPASRDTP
ncbi:MAG: FecR domain-containing protein [Deltaproteobacteria bacterium]|nr:FecR domain-containing protein [Deltaproteobacteria bacterium]